MTTITDLVNQIDRDLLTQNGVKQSAKTLCLAAQRQGPRLRQYMLHHRITGGQPCGSFCHTVRPVDDPADQRARPQVRQTGMKFR